MGACDKKMATYEAWTPEGGRAVIARHKGLQGAALPILHAIQETFGYVPVEAGPLVAEALNLSRADLHGTISFYHDFRRVPPGRHVLKLCRAEACQAMGAEALHAETRRRLGVDWHGTTADGALTLEPAFCLGLCAAGPAALIDGEPLCRLDAAGIEGLVREFRA